MGFAATFLGGNVNLITPTADFKYFHMSPLNKKHVLAFHVMGTMSTGFNGKDVPPFDRGFIGGEQDVRGFQIMGITPIGWVAVIHLDPRATTPTAAPAPKTMVSNGAITSTPVNMTIPMYQLVTPGGDTRVIGNFEYRIPIVPNVVTLAPFFDVGIDQDHLSAPACSGPHAHRRFERAVPRGWHLTERSRSRPARRRFALPRAWNCR